MVYSNNVTIGRTHKLTSMLKGHEAQISTIYNPLDAQLNKLEPLKTVICLNKQ